MEKQDIDFLTIARAIPIGSRNIERMRQEIHNTVTAVLGLVGKYTESNLGEKVNNYQWTIGPGFGANGPVVECRYCPTIVGGISSVVVYNSFRVVMGEGSIPIQYVQRVYEVLGHFIKLMYETFPELPHKLKPLIQAGGVNHELFR